MADDKPEIMGAATLMLISSLIAQLNRKGLLDKGDVQSIFKTARTEMAREQGSEEVVALLDNLAAKTL